MDGPLVAILTHFSDQMVLQLKIKIPTMTIEWWLLFELWTCTVDLFSQCLFIFLVFQPDINETFVSQRVVQPKRKYDHDASRGTESRTVEHKFYLWHFIYGLFISCPSQYPCLYLKAYSRPIHICNSFVQTNDAMPDRLTPGEITSIVAFGIDILCGYAAYRLQRKFCNIIDDIKVNNM